jgi:hypothetical protein
MVSPFFEMEIYLLIYIVEKESLLKAKIDFIKKIKPNVFDSSKVRLMVSTIKRDPVLIGLPFQTTVQR